RHARFPHLSACLAVACIACSSSPKPSTADNQQTDGRGTPEKDAAPSAPMKEASVEPECNGPGYAGMPSDRHFVHLSAPVVDEAGKPLPDIIAQACGTNICLNGTTGSDGSVVIDQDVPTMTKPAFKYGGGELYAKFALPLTDDTVKV